MRSVVTEKIIMLKPVLCDFIKTDTLPQYSPRMYPEDIRTLFHIKAPAKEKYINLEYFILLIPAGNDMYVRAMGKSLNIKTEKSPCFSNFSSAEVMPDLTVGCFLPRFSINALPVLPMKKQKLHPMTAPKTETKTEGISSILPLYILHPIKGRSISLDTGKQAYSSAVDKKTPIYPNLSTIFIRYIIKSVKTMHLLKKDMPF